MNNTFKLGRSIAQMVPFQRIPISKEHQQREIFTTKLIITMAAIAIEDWLRLNLAKYKLIELKKSETGPTK